jgi:hypothetical protein
MLHKEERMFIYKNAYLPEQLPDYVEAVSGEEPHLQDEYLCFTGRKHLTFIGYPLGSKATDAPEKTEEAYRSCCERFLPETAAIICPEIWLPPGTCEHQPADRYYRLALPLKTLNQGLRYMVGRGERELKVMEGHFGREHKKIIKFFVSKRKLNPQMKKIFSRIPKYMGRSETAFLLEARRGDDLAAFNILDFGSSFHAFHLFNFRSFKIDVPGASDLLFSEMARIAFSRGKKALNLGLGINDGVRRFKEKWGARPFLSHESALVNLKPAEPGALMKKL